MSEMKDRTDTLVMDQTSRTSKTSSAVTDGMAPKHIAQYGLRQEIGRSARSVVYEAQDTQTGQEVALKMLMLPASITPEEARSLIAGFEREAGIAARLSHPNIVRTYEVSPSLNRHVIVMEHLQGQTLRNRMSEGRLIPEEAFSLLTQIAGALDAVHKAGIVHRNVKPASVMVLPNGAAKLLGFGHARSSAEAAVIRDGVLDGSPSYMAPEQIQGETGTAATDIWALGALSYEMLTGRLPYTGLTGEGVMFQITHLSPAPMPDLQPAVQKALLRALDKIPSQRYVTASDFIQALKSAHLRQAPAPAKQKAAKLSPLSFPKPLLFKPLLFPKWLPRAVLLSLFLLGFCGAALVRFQSSHSAREEEASQISAPAPATRAPAADVAPPPSTLAVPPAAHLTATARPELRRKYPVVQVKSAAAQASTVHAVQTRAVQTMASVPVPTRQHSVATQPSVSAEPVSIKTEPVSIKQVARRNVSLPSVSHGATVRVVPQLVPLQSVSPPASKQVASQPGLVPKTDHGASVRDAAPPVTAESSADQSFTLPADEGGYDPEAAARLRKSAWSQNGSTPATRH